MEHDAGLWALLPSALLLLGSSIMEQPCWSQLAPHMGVNLGGDLVMFPEASSPPSHLHGVSVCPTRTTEAPTHAGLYKPFRLLLNIETFSVPWLGFTGSWGSEFPKPFLSKSSIFQPQPSPQLVGSLLQLLQPLIVRFRYATWLKAFRTQGESRQKFTSEVIY